MRRPTTKTNIILLTLGGLLAAGGILFAVLKLLPGKEVPVVAVSDWSIGWMSDDICRPTSVSRMWQPNWVPRHGG